MPVLLSTLVAKTITFCFPTGHQTGLPGPNPSGPGHQGNCPSSNATPCSLALAPRVRIPCPNSQGCQQWGHKACHPYLPLQPALQPAKRTCKRFPGHTFLFLPFPPVPST